METIHEMLLKRIPLLPSLQTRRPQDARVDAFAGRQRGPGHEDHREQKSQLLTGTLQGLVRPRPSLPPGLGILSLSSSSSSCIPAGGLWAGLTGAAAAWDTGRPWAALVTSHQLF